VPRARIADWAAGSSSTAGKVCKCKNPGNINHNR
jgi:hypothetical protein